MLHDIDTHAELEYVNAMPIRNVSQQIVEYFQT
jgi:hypothetical protein